MFTNSILNITRGRYEGYSTISLNPLSVKKVKPNPKETRQRSIVAIPKTSKKLKEVSKKEDEKPNKLYYGDNLDILRKYIKDESIDLFSICFYRRINKFLSGRIKF